MSKKKIIVISIIILFIIGIFASSYIVKQKKIEEIDIQIYNIDFDIVTDIFCIEGTKYKNEKGKDIIKDYKINTKLLATKIYVYVKKHGEFSNLEYFYNQYTGDATNLDGEANGLYGNIYKKDRADFSLKFQKELEQQQLEIEKIEEWLKNGELQKLEEWLSKQDF